MDAVPGFQKRLEVIADISSSQLTDCQVLFDRLALVGFEHHAIQDGCLWLNDRFISTKPASELQIVLIEETEWIQPVIKMGKRTIESPRLAAWHGDPGAVYTYSGFRNTPAPWTPTLQKIRKNLAHSTGVEFNSVLLNYYRSGSDSMGWHRDNERELGPEPVIASISLGESRRFRMQHIKDKQQRWDAYLDHGSALIMAGSTQQYWRHCLPKSKSCNGNRINLTFRQVQQPT